MIDDQLTASVKAFLSKYRKPAVLQNVWTDDYPSEVAPYKRLSAMDWSVLDDATLRSFEGPLEDLNGDAWRAFVPALMMAALERPYLTWEREGTLVTTLVSFMSRDIERVAPGLHCAVLTFTPDERQLVCNWLNWFAKQLPNLDALPEYERSRYIRLREFEVEDAVRRIREV